MSSDKEETSVPERPAKDTAPEEPTSLRPAGPEGAPPAPTSEMFDMPKDPQDTEPEVTPSRPPGESGAPSISEESTESTSDSGDSSLTAAELKDSQVSNRPSSPQLGLDENSDSSPADATASSSVVDANNPHDTTPAANGAETQPLHGESEGLAIPANPTDSGNQQGDSTSTTASPQNEQSKSSGPSSSAELPTGHAPRSAEVAPGASSELPRVHPEGIAGPSDTAIEQKDGEDKFGPDRASLQVLTEFGKNVVAEWADIPKDVVDDVGAHLQASILQIESAVRSIERRLNGDE